MNTIVDWDASNQTTNTRLKCGRSGVKINPQSAQVWPRRYEHNCWLGCVKPDHSVWQQSGKIDKFEIRIKYFWNSKIHGFCNFKWEKKNNFLIFLQFQKSKIVIFGICTPYVLSRFRALKDGISYTNYEMHRKLAHLTSRLNTWHDVIQVRHSSTVLEHQLRNASKIGNSNIQT